MTHPQSDRQDDGLRLRCPVCNKPLSPGDFCDDLQCPNPAASRDAAEGAEHERPLPRGGVEPDWHAESIKLYRANKKLRTALQEQHNWHLTQGDQDFVDGITLNMAEEYSDSAMYERTVAVLTEVLPPGIEGYQKFKDRLRAAPPKPAPDAMRKALQEAVTHKEAWRQIIDNAREVASDSRDDMDEKGYLAHELRAFDKAFAMVDAALSAPVPPADGARKRWYLASQNDGLFIINAEPRPSNDDQWHDRPNGPSIVLNVTELPEAKAIKIVGVMNELAYPSPAVAAEPVDVQPDYEAAARALGYQQIPSGIWFHPNQHPNFTERFKRAEDIFDLYFGKHWPSAAPPVRGDR